jgi:hypothetical protein
MFDSQSLSPFGCFSVQGSSVVLRADWNLTENETERTVSVHHEAGNINTLGMQNLI